MAETYDVQALQTAVRAVMQNQPEDVLPDAELNISLLQAIAVMSSDSPRMVSATIAGTGSSYYPLSTIPGWTSGYSVIDYVNYPAVDIVTYEAPTYLRQSDYTLVDVDGAAHLFLQQRWPVGKSGIVRFKAPWVVEGLNGDVTVLDMPHRVALEHKAIELLARSMQFKASGNLEAFIPDDLVDHGQQAVRYGEIAQTYKTLYSTVLGLNDDATLPHFATTSVRGLGRSTGRYLTHRRIY